MQGPLESHKPRSRLTRFLLGLFVSLSCRAAEQRNRTKCNENEKQMRINIILYLSRVSLCYYCCQIVSTALCVCVYCFACMFELVSARLGRWTKDHSNRLSFWYTIWCRRRSNDFKQKNKIMLELDTKTKMYQCMHDKENNGKSSKHTHTHTQRERASERGF